MRRYRTSDGVTRIECSTSELANLLALTPAQLQEATRLFPCDPGVPGRYTLSSRAALKEMRKRAAVLRTGMRERAVMTVEQAGYLDAYADLAEDCPSGLTAHVWRSYALIAMMQIRHGVKIGAGELAERAKLRDVEMARKHIRLLVWLGFLIDRGDHWEHKGMPRAFRTTDRASS